MRETCVGCINCDRIHIATGICFPGPKPYCRLLPLGVAPLRAVGPDFLGPGHVNEGRDMMTKAPHRQTRLGVLEGALRSSRADVPRPGSTFHIASTSKTAALRAARNTAEEIFQ